MEIKIAETMPDKECYLMDPMFFRFYKMKESQIIKAQKELNKVLENSVMSYGEVIDILLKDLTDEQREIYEANRDKGWTENNLGIGKCELIREQVTTEDGKTIIRFLLDDQSDDEDES